MNAIPMRVVSIGRILTIGLAAGIATIILTASPLLGILASALVVALLEEVWPSPTGVAAKREIGTLRARLNDPNRVVREAEALARQRRYGPTSGSYGRGPE
jgi:hypothetical protein